MTTSAITCPGEERDRRRRVFIAWLCQLLASEMLSWLLRLTFGSLALPPVARLGNEYPLETALALSCALLLLYAIASRYLPAIEAPISWLCDGRWRVAALLLLVVANLVALAAPRLCAVERALSATRYAAHRPGCDASADQWRQRGAPTTLDCAPSGVRISFPAIPGAFGELSYPLASDLRSLQDYRVEVVAALGIGDRSAQVGIGVDGQNPGGIVSLIDASGGWRIVLFSRAGQRVRILASGHFQHPARAYPLAVEVHGSRLMFFVNGEQVASVIDSTYNTTQYTLLALAGSRSASATFADYIFTAYPAPPLPCAGKNT